MALVAACSTERPVVIVDGTTYEAVLPAASGGGERHIRITLKPDGAAALSSAFSAIPSRTLVEGTWEHKEGLVMLSLPGERMVLRQTGDQLIAREWDRARWGESGPGVLFRVR